MKFSTLKMVLTAMMIALTFVVTTLYIPTGVGYFNLGDAVIIVTAVLLGRTAGLIAGGIGSAMADIYLGYGLFAPFTLVVKGAEGFIVGTIVKKIKLPSIVSIIIASIIGVSVMVAGYFVSEIMILPIFDKSFGYAKAMSDLATNLAQAVSTACLGILISILLSSIKPITKYLE